MLMLCSSCQCFSTWVQGIRTVIASSSNATQEHVAEGLLHNETWVYYPGEAFLIQYEPKLRCCPLSRPQYTATSAAQDFSS